jgi:hypothetical protein
VDQPVKPGQGAPAQVGGIVGLGQIIDEPERAFQRAQ